MTFWRTLGNFWRRNTKNWIKIALLLILVLAAFLRFYRLDAQSLWADDGNGEASHNCRLGLVATFLSALFPFQVYYSPETRMYILLAALSAFSVA